MMPQFFFVAFAAPERQTQAWRRLGKIQRVKTQGAKTSENFAEEKNLSAPKSQRFLQFAIAMPIADPRIAAISETRESNPALRFKGAMESR